MNLEDLTTDVSDITEPACMEKLLMYLDQLQIEDEAFMRLILDRVPDMTITWDQPWYQRSNCLTRPFTDVDDDNIEKPLSGSISKAENERVAKNWRKFRKVYNLPDTLICFARWKNKDKSRNPNTPEERARHFVTAYLAKGLARTLHQIYKHITTFFGYPEKGPYSEKEEKIMEICFYHRPNNAAPFLSAILSREPRNIYKRLYYMYNEKPAKRKLKWTLELASKFLNALIQHSGLPLEKLKYQNFDKEVWMKLQEVMDHQYRYLHIFWWTSLHTQIFVKYNVTIKQLRKKILKKLRSFNYQVWSDIRWKELAKHFPDGFTHHFLYRTTYGIIQRCPNLRHAPLEDIIEYGLKKLKSIKNRRLKTLKLNENGVLEVIKYDVELFD